MENKTVKFTNENVRFSPYGAADAAEAAEAEKICFSVPWTTDDFRAALESGYMGVVAREGETLAGYGFIMRAADEATLENLAVMPRFRRAGIGGAITEMLLHVAEADGARVCFLEVRASNEAARRLYEKAGFREISVRRDYYEKPTEDAVIMKKELNLQ